MDELAALAVLAIILVIAVPIISLCLQISINGRTKREFDRLNRQIDSLKQQRRPDQSQVKPEVKAAPEQTFKAAADAPKPEKPKAAPAPPAPKAEEVEQAPSIAVPPSPPVATPPPAPPAPPSPQERKPKRNWERLIGENILNKIGIAILVLGIGFLIRYSFNLIAKEEFANVAMGALSGGLLLFFAHRFRLKMRAFSAVLSGGAIAVFYATTAIAFKQYEIVGQIPAFAIMIAITALSVILSLAYDKKEFAIISILGGFATPLMVSTGTGDHIVLFSYLLLLNVGLLTLAYFKQWRVVNILCFALSFGFMGFWIYDKIWFIGSAPNKALALELFLFTGGFYLLFVFQSIIYNLRRGLRFNLLDFTMLLLSNALFFGIGIWMLQVHSDQAYTGLFTGALALFNMILSFFIFQRKTSDKRLIFLMLGMTVSFVSIIAPVQLEGNFITIFWASEAVLMLWFAQRIKVPLLKWASMLLMGLMTCSLLLDWINIYLDAGIDESPLTMFANRGFITSAFATLGALAFAKLYGHYHHKPTKGVHYIFWTIFKSLAAVLAYFTLLFEINYQTDQLILHSYAAKVLVVGLYNAAVLALIYFSGKTNIVMRYLSGALFLIFFFGYLAHYQGAMVDVRNLFLTDGSAVWPLTVHYGSLLLSMSVPIHLSWKFLRNDDRIKEWVAIGPWMMALLALVVVSFEFNHVAALIGYTKGESIPHLIGQWNRAGYAVCWGLVAFIAMRAGIKKKLVMLRIVSLSIFSLILLKLFLVDIRDIPEGGRIIAFIGLGILLLTVSFMYQKLKTLIFPENPAQ